MPDARLDAIEQCPYYEPLREYTRKAIPFLEERCSKAPPQPMGLERWSRDNDGRFRLRPSPEMPWWLCAIRVLHETEVWGEYQHSVDALRADPVIASQMDALIGAGGTAQTVPARQVIDRLVFRVTEQLGALRYDEDIFQTAFHSLREDLHRTELDFVLLAPVSGLRLEKAPLELERGVALDHFTDSEIGQCLDVGFLPDPFGRFIPARDIEQLDGIRVRFRLAKRVGQQNDEATNDVAAARAWHEKVVSVLQALRLFKAGTTSLAGLAQFCLQWPMQGMIQYTLMNQGPTPWANQYSLNETEEEALLTLWAQLNKAKPKEIVALAIRRFSYAAERERPDDRLVDLMIAAESLFLGGSDDPRDRGEMRQKLSIRAGFFIESPQFTRMEVLRFMRGAYDARSAIVHGGSGADLDDLKSPKGQKMAPHEFIALVEEMMRLALKKAVTVAEKVKGPLIEWEEALLR